MKVELVVFRKEYLNFLEELWKDPKVNRYTGMPPGGIDMGLWLKQYEASKVRGGFSSEQYIILLDGRPIGEIAFGLTPRAFAFGSWEKDINRPCAIADIKLKKDKWGKGIERRALAKLIHIIFDRSPAADIISIPHKDDKRTRRILKGCGFEFSGHSNPEGNLIYILQRENYQDGQDRDIPHG